MDNQGIFINTDGLYIGLPEKIKCNQCGKTHITNQSTNYLYNSSIKVWCDGIIYIEDEYGNKIEESCHNLIWANITLRSRK